MRKRESSRGHAAALIARVNWTSQFGAQAGGHPQVPLTRQPVGCRLAGLLAILADQPASSEAQMPERDDPPFNQALSQDPPSSRICENTQGLARGVRGGPLMIAVYSRAGQQFG
jgi:hypothetical protein